MLSITKDAHHLFEPDCCWQYLMCLKATMTYVLENIDIVILI